MAQTLKEKVRDRILFSAENHFAALGYQKATMKEIAETANVAVGNIYKYFPNKKALLKEIIDNEFVTTFRDLTIKRVEKLNDPSKMNEVESINEETSRELMNFWINNRKKTIILLAKSEGSEFETFRNEYIKQMISLTYTLLPKMRPNLPNTGIFQFSFENRIEDTVRNIVLILEKYETENEIKSAFAASWSYHHAGIQGLIKWFSDNGKGC